MILLPTICPQLAVAGRTELDFTGRQRGTTRVAKVQVNTIASLVLAEGVGFEPTMSVTTHSGFQDRRHRPLGEPSMAPAHRPRRASVCQTSRDVPPAQGHGWRIVTRLYTAPPRTNHALR